MNTPANITRLIPQEVEVEAAVLGCMIGDAECIPQIQHILNADCFNDPRHRAVYEAVDGMIRANKSLDIITVCQELKEAEKLKDVGGPYFVTQLTNRVSQSGHVKEYALILQQYRIRRLFIEGGALLQQKAFDDSFDSLDLPILANKLAEGASIEAFKEPRTMASAAKDFNDYLESTSEGGLQTGLINIDRIICGLMGGDLFYVAGRPGMGKTALALAIMLNMARQGKVCAFFSLEMTERQLLQRLCAMITGIPIAKIRAKDLNQQERAEIGEALGELHELPIIVHDQAGITAEEFRSKAKYIQAKHGLDCIFLDYLGLMGESMYRGDKNNSTGYNSTTIKNTLKDLDVPGIVLHQLSRAVESRPDKKPMLSDLRDSGQIEQDANQVCMLWRPAYYDGLMQENGEPYPEDYAAGLIVKNRDGACMDAELQFIGKQGLYKDWENLAFN